MTGIFFRDGAYNAVAKTSISLAIHHALIQNSKSPFWVGVKPETGFSKVSTRVMTRHNHGNRQRQHQETVVFPNCHMTRDEQILSSCTNAYRPSPTRTTPRSARACGPSSCSRRPRRRPRSRSGCSSYARTLPSAAARLTPRSPASAPTRKITFHIFVLKE